MCKCYSSNFLTVAYAVISNGIALTTPNNPVLVNGVCSRGLPVHVTTVQVLVPLSGPSFWKNWDYLRSRIRSPLSLIRFL